MGFLTKEGLQNLTNKLVQGDAIKVASHRGKNVKEVIDNIQRECENVALPNTMTLENRVSEFKVGKSRDINVSNDIEESKIELKLKGQTYHNLCKSKCDFKAQYPSNFNTQTYDDKVVVTRINENNSGWAYYCNNTLKAKMLKPSTVYTLFFKYETNFTNVPRVQFIQGNALQHLSDHYDATKIKDNIYMCKITTISSFDDKEIGSQVLYFYNSPRKTGDKITLYKHMVLLEGDYSETPIDEIPKYFEGIKSSFEDGIVDVKVQGKNFVDLSKFNRASNEVSQVNIVNNTISFSSSKRYNGVGQIFSKEEYKKMVGKYVTVSCGKITTSTGDSNDAYVFLKQSFVNSDGSTTWNNSTIVSGQSKKIKILEGVDLTNFGVFVEPSNPVSGSIDIKAENIQLEIDNTSTSYEPYYEKKISFNIGEPLRSLPNGAYDEIRNNNGQWELVRRTATAIINGTESWERSYSNWNNIVFCCSDNYFPGIRSIDTSTKNVIANTLPSMHIGALCSVLGNTGICTHNWSTKKMQVAIKDIDTVEKIKAWFTNNPTKVIYELTKPIITPIEPIEFNISQGAVINISSDISPTSNYKVVLNRAGQIEQGIELIANLKSRINELENIYDSNLIATQYRLNNLKLNYELEREED